MSTPNNGINGTLGEIVKVSYGREIDGFSG